LVQALPGWVPNRMQLNWDPARWTDAHGWCGIAPDAISPEDRRRALAETGNQYRPALTGYTLGGPNRAGLCDLLELCRAEGIPATVVLLPEATEFRHWHDADTSAQIDAFVGALRGSEVPVIDGRGWIADALFSDGHHLLRPGARAFTDRLARELRTGPRWNIRSRCHAHGSGVGVAP
jgi:hypothetical protein